MGSRPRAPARQIRRMAPGRRGDRLAHVVRFRGIRRFIAAMPGLLLVACGDGDEAGSGVPASGSLDFPTPPPVEAATVEQSDFAGAEACAGCHADQYDAWAESTHGRAGGEPGPEVVIATFDGRPIRFADGTVTPRITGGTHEFVVRQDGFPDEVHRVDGVIGRAHMLGGGTQGFISRQSDGTERFLPWDWSGTGAEWFCNTGSRLDRGWEPITAEMRLADCGDWPPVRPIGTVDRFANCQECHGSQIETALDPGNGFTTSYTTLQVNCESCHGPAARHVELATAAAGDRLADVGIESLAHLDKDEALGVCFQCHALKDVLAEGYLPGESLEAYYALKYPVLGDQPYSADGRVRSFAYQANHLASACYLLGPMDCASCHEPHAQGYWTVDREPLPDPLDDGQCTSCHPSKMLDVEAHTFHPAESAGSACVSCHMPYLQHPEVGDQPYSADGRVRSFAYQANHLASACYLLGPMDCASCHEPHGQGYWTVDREPLPDPLDDGQCTSCHPSKMLDVEAHTFHPAESAGSACVSCHMPYLQHPEVGDGVAFARSDHTIAVPRPVFDADLGIEGACVQCHADRSPPQLQSQAREWWGEPKPHRPLIEGIASEFRARNLAEAGELLLQPDEVDPLIQFQAMSRLLTGYMQPDVPGLPPVVEERLLALTEAPDLDVRSLAAASLHWSRGDDPAVRARLIETLREAEVDAPLRRRWMLALGFLGDRARDDGDFAESAAAYRKALELSPGDTRVLHALGQMHSRAGAYGLAVDAIRESLAADPEQPLAWVNLGIALAANGNPGGAREAYAEALRINPHEALAYFNLGNTLQRAERYQEAAEAYANAVENDPGLGLAHFELGRTFIRLERFEDALTHARRAVEFLEDHEGSRQMLADLERALGA